MSLHYNAFWICYSLTCLDYDGISLAWDKKYLALKNSKLDDNST